MWVYCFLCHITTECTLKSKALIQHYQKKTTVEILINFDKTIISTIVLSDRNILHSMKASRRGD